MNFTGMKKALAAGLAMVAMTVALVGCGSDTAEKKFFHSSPGRLWQ